MLIPLNNPPSTGQFVAIWEYEGKIWSETYCWKNGKLYALYEDDDNSQQWLEMPGICKTYPGQTNKLYWIREEDL